MLKLDMPAWATLLGLIDECPVIPGEQSAHHAAPGHARSARRTFEFISERGQIAAVHEFMESLPDTLRA